jgi:hypothetical protein
MPLQNRVDPWGELVAAESRGTLMGNRGGRFHAPGRLLGKRRWASRRWIACELEFKGRRRNVWGEGYTEVFFLDEVTALAAGHRPCFECRRKEAKAFVSGGVLADFDRRLHAERLGPRLHQPLTDLPEGVMVEVDGKAFALRGRKLLHWSHSGYISAMAIRPDLHVKLLTPPAIAAILAAGYQPRWHSSAQQWDD